MIDSDGRRLWYVIRKGRMHCEALTDEKALERLERGEDLRPVGGAERVAAELWASASDQK